MTFMDSLFGDDPVVMKNLYFNESLAELVKNLKARDVIIETDGRILNQLNPVFQDPSPEHALDYQTAFFVPEKKLLGYTFSTPVFNILVIWFWTIVLYITLYFGWLERLVRFLSRPKS